MRTPRGFKAGKMIPVKVKPTIARLAVGEAAVVGPCTHGAVSHAFKSTGGTFSRKRVMLIDTVESTAVWVYYVERVE